MNLKKINAKTTTYIQTDSICNITNNDILFLKEEAKKDKLGRSRICLHSDNNELIHEMLIVQLKDTYIQPHKHIGKSESFHIIEGSMYVIIFNEQGKIKKIFYLDANTQTPNSSIIYRLSKDYWHSILPCSNFVVFHETTNGPFNPAQTQFPYWAPDEIQSNSEEINKFKQQLNEEIKNREGKYDLQTL